MNFLPLERATFDTLSKHYPSFDTKVQWMAVELDNNAAKNPCVLSGTVKDVLVVMEHQFFVGLRDDDMPTAAEQISLLQESNGNVVQLFVVDMVHNIQVI